MSSIGTEAYGEDNRSSTVSVKGSYGENPSGGEDRAVFVISVEYFETESGETPKIEIVLEDGVTGSLEDDLSMVLEGLLLVFEDCEPTDG